MNKAESRTPDAKLESWYIKIFGKKGGTFYPSAERCSMKKNSSGVLASMAVAIGLLGSFAIGCGTDVNPPFQPSPDSIGDRNPPLTDVVPIEKGDIELVRSSS